MLAFLRENRLEAASDLAIVDHHMPAMTGAQLVAELRARGYRLRVIALTGNAGADEAMRAAGVALVLRKPSREQPLLAAIRELLGEG